MTCDECRSDLIFFAGRQLTGAEESGIALHLEGCEACRHALEEELQFARAVHNASVPFRAAVGKGEGRLDRAIIPAESPRSRLAGGIFRMPRIPWIAAAVLGVSLAIAFFALLRAPGGEIDRVSAWAVDHYPLIDQTHPLRGGPEDVRTWFREHHGVEVSPPRAVDYASLAGCKMTDLDADPAPLLRFEGKDTSGVFLLPAKLAHEFSGPAREVRKGSFSLEFWSEGTNAFLRITRRGPSGVI